VSIALIRSVILSVCLCVSVRTIKQKQLKPKSLNLEKGWSITIPCPPMNTRSKVTGSKSAKCLDGRDSRAVPSRCTVTPLNEAAPHGRHRRELCTLSSAQPLVFCSTCFFKQLALCDVLHSCSIRSGSRISVWRSSCRTGALLSSVRASSSSRTT